MTATAPTLLTRVIPPAVRPSHRVKHLIERNWLGFKSYWWVIIAGFFEPIFYLFSIGIGIGALVGDVALPNGDFVPYAAFVAPAMLAASAMNGAVYESTFNIFFKLKYGNTYKAALATPIGPGDIAVSEIIWSLSRGAIYSSAFLIVMVFTGYATSWWALMALPASILIGFAFGAVGMAATTFMNSWQDFDKVQLVTCHCSCSQEPSTRSAYIHRSSKGSPRSARSTTGSNWSEHSHLATWALNSGPMPCS